MHEVIQHLNLAFFKRNGIKSFQNNLYYEKPFETGAAASWAKMKLI